MFLWHILDCHEVADAPELRHEMFFGHGRGQVANE
jgi:hypothetical protein